MYMDKQHEYVNHMIIKQREKKHREIMNAIYTYKRSVEEIRTLQKIKQSTKMEIDLRYKNSSHNHTYKFPYREDSPNEERDEESFPNNNAVLYDLHSQSEVIKKTLSTKTLSLEASRRVKSLQKEHVNEEEQIISKIKRKPLRLAQAQQKSELLIRKNSLRDRKKGESSMFKLPQLRRVPSEKKTNLEEVVGRKITTETSSPNGKRLAKYLKVAEENGITSLKKEKPKKFFLHEC